MSEPSKPAPPLPESAPSGATRQVAPPGPGPIAEPTPTPASQLTPEEQMAAFEKELKEKDWGHQPC